MASNFTVLGSSNGTELQGGNTVVPVQDFAVQTKPSGIYFEFRRPVSQLQKLDAAGRVALINDVAGQLATRIEEVMSEPAVTWMTYSQPTNAAGQLLDVLTVYVQSDSGNSQGTITIPLADIGPGKYTTSRVNAEVAALNAAEAL